MEKKDKKISVYKEYLSDKKTVMTLFSLTIAFVLVILLSFGTNFFFRDLDDSFFTDLMISFALCVYCLYFGIPEGKNLYQKKSNGKYLNAIHLFEDARKESIKRDFEFNQRLEQYYQKNKRDYFLSILSLHGNINPYALDLDYLELDNLKRPYKKEWKDTEFEGRPTTYFRTMTDKQIEILKEIYNGNIKVERIPDDFFKTLNGKILISEYIEQMRDRKKHWMQLAMLIVGRIIMVFAFAFVFSSFGMELSQTEDWSERFNQIFTLLSRLWTMLSSFVYGFSLGKFIVMKDANVLEYKARVNTEFNNDTRFVYQSEDELAKKEYDKYEKEHKVEVDILPIHPKHTIMIEEKL